MTAKAAANLFYVSLVLYVVTVGGLVYAGRSRTETPTPAQQAVNEYTNLTKVCDNLKGTFVVENYSLWRIASPHAYCVVNKVQIDLGITRLEREETK